MNAFLSACHLEIPDLSLWLGQVVSFTTDWGTEAGIAEAAGRPLHELLPHYWHEHFLDDPSLGSVAVSQSDAGDCGHVGEGDVDFLDGGTQLGEVEAADSWLDEEHGLVAQQAAQQDGCQHPNCLQIVEHANLKKWQVIRGSSKHWIFKPPRWLRRTRGMKVEQELTT